MFSRAPKHIAIDHDDDRARHIGRTSTGQQFFLTTPFEPATNGSPGCEFIALYLFTRRGRLIEARIDSLGPRAASNEQARAVLYAKRLEELGEVSFERITISPFTVERFGSTFGLVTSAPEDGDDSWTVEVQPGNYMAFYPPWDSGEYDT